VSSELRVPLDLPPLNLLKSAALLTFSCHLKICDCKILQICVSGVFIHPNCTDNPFFANCRLIVAGQYCTHKYYARFCCKSCTQAGQLPSYGPHLEKSGTGISSSRRK
jgi:hypothetical protein